MGTDSKLASRVPMRLFGAITGILFLAASVSVPLRARGAEAPPEEGGAPPPAAHAADPADPPIPEDEPIDAEDDIPPVPAETEKEAPPVVTAPEFLRRPPVGAVRKQAPKQDLPDIVEPQLPEDAPPPSDNELTAALGWNSDTPVGLRYLRRIEGTPVSFGLGLGFVTMWGPKLSAIVRLQPSFERGFFAQISAGYSLGGSFTAQVPLQGGEAQTAHLVRTPSRTADLMVGWRMPLAANFLEASAGYSFNIQGTVLQEQLVDGHMNRTQVPFDVSTIPFNKAGGVAGAVSYGWLF